MVENMTAIQAENIRTLASHVLSLIQSDSPHSNVRAAYDLLGSACAEYENKLLYRMWKFHASPERMIAGCLGMIDFARSESQGIDTRLSAAPPEVQEIVQAYLRERDENAKLKQ
jgi:hypothetical protein